MSTYYQKLDELFKTLDADSEERINLMRFYRNMPADIAIKKMNIQIQEIRYGNGCERYQPNHDK